MQQEEKTALDIITTFTGILRQLDGQVSLTAAATLMQMVAEIVDLLQSTPPRLVPPDIVTKPMRSVSKISLTGLVKPELTKRGKPRLTKEEIAARRKAVWTPGKRQAQRALALAREQVRRARGAL